MAMKKFAMCEPMMCCLFDEGYTTTQIADVFGATRPTVVRRLKDKGYVFQGGNRPKSVCPALVMCLRNCGQSIYEISEISGASKSAVYDMCRFLCVGDIGLHSGHSGYIDDDDIRELAEHGMSSVAIANKLGIPQTTVSAHLRRMGLSKPRDCYNNKRHEEALKNATQVVAPYVSKYGFDVINCIDKYHFDVKCRKCAYERKWTKDFRYGIKCPECEKVRREAEWWAKPKVQMQLHFPSARQNKPKDMDAERTCRVCGKTFTESEWVEKYGANTDKRCHVFCSPHCKKTASRRDRRLIQKRASVLSWKKVMKRDGCECALCGLPVKPNDFTRTEEGYFIAGNYYPSVDHIIPLSKGGEHTYENAQLAHCYCNSVKRDRVEVGA